MIGAMPAAYGDPIVAHPSPAVRALRRCRGARGTQTRVRGAYGPPAARGARGGRKVQFYRPAGAIFTRARRAVRERTRSRYRNELLKVLLLKMDALLQLQ